MTWFLEVVETFVPFELLTGTSPDVFAWREEESVDDKVLDQGQVVEQSHVVVTELEAGDQQVEGLASDPSVPRADDFLLAADARVQRLCCRATAGAGRRGRPVATRRPRAARRTVTASPASQEPDTKSFGC